MPYFGKIFVAVAILSCIIGINPAAAFTNGIFQPASAEEIERFLPDGSAVPQQTLQEKSHISTEIPFGDQNLEYEIRLPTSWKASKFTQFGDIKQDKYDVPTNIGRYYGPAIGGVLPYVLIEAYRPGYTLLLEDHVAMFMRKRGISPKAVYQDEKGRIHATYVELDGVESFIKRSLFLRHGDTTLNVQIVVPFSSFQNMKDLMGVVLNSFTLLKMPEQENLEPMTQERLLNVLRFQYPESWESIRKSDENALHLRSVFHRYDFREALKGVIAIEAIRKTELRTIPAEMARIHRSLERSGLTIGQQIQSLPFPKNDNSSYKFSIVETYKAEKLEPERTDEFGIIVEDAQVIDQEVWVAVAENNHSFIIGFMITVDSQTSFQEWVRNRGAFLTILESAQLRND